MVLVQGRACHREARSSERMATPDQRAGAHFCWEYTTYVIVGMDKLPFYTFRGGRGVPSSRFLTLGLLAAAFSLVSFHLILGYQYATSTSHNIPINATSILDKCRLLNVKPGVSHNFHRRTQSDRFVPGTPPILIKNATIWTGRVSGLEVVVGDLLLSKGLIKAVGDIDQHVLDAYGSDLVVADAGGAWVSPG